MPLADRMAALLVEEATALRRGDAEAVLFLSQQKNELMLFRGRNSKNEVSFFGPYS